MVFSSAVSSSKVKLGGVDGTSAARGWHISYDLARYDGGTVELTQSEGMALPVSSNGGQVEAHP